ncbi:MAG: YfhO family protein [Bacteroidales bacterium]|nr:YfhO family protein [Bacteroidales bacterium]
MDFKKLIEKACPDVLVVCIFLLISTFYFLTPLSEGLVLGGHDSVAAMGQGQEQKEYMAAHDGEPTRWSNALFSGMPTYQMSPSYSATETLSNASKAYGLWTSSWFPPINYLFLYLLGFYILLRAFNFKPYLAALGSILWAFSSYFLIIIAAGHIWKVLTLAFIPPTIGGLILCYRGKLLWGGTVTAIFTAFQIMSNHFQMSYYFLFPMLFLALAYGVDALLHRRLLGWLKATLMLAFAGLLGVAANLPNLYHTYEYSKASLRGKAELSAPADSQKAQARATDGLDRDYITAWSYGVDETLTLLIPDYKGGGSTSILDREGVESLKGYDDFYECAGQTQQAFQESGLQAYPPGVQQYWGDQPFTVGPVYVGAFVCFLFVLGLFYVKGPVKWAMLLATMVSLLFAWGKHMPALTDFFIDYLPLYAKFRTVSSALVVAEFAMPLLAVLCLRTIMADKQLFRLTDWKHAPLEKRVGLPIAALATAGLCLLLWLCPQAAGSCISAADADTFALMRQAGFPAELVLRYETALSSMHHAILSADALRSLFIILLGALLLWAYAEGKMKGWMACSLLGLMCLIDLWQIDRRYLNEDSFTTPQLQQEGFAKTPADEQILKDTTYYRVANLGAGNPFNETTNATSYYHHSIGGYHAAKLHRYQDLIDRKLGSELQQFVGAINAAEGDLSQVPGDSLAPALNMLNTKYFIFGSGARAQAVLNPYANGNGWFVERLDFVPTADAEMAALQQLDTKHAAVADARFRAQLDGSPLGQGTVKLTAYAPNQLSYDIESSQGGVVVFSEIYYPDWSVTIDGQPATLGRANYVLRALKVPAGRHHVTMEFRPASIGHTNRIAYAAQALTVLLLLGAVLRHRKKANKMR